MVTTVVSPRLIAAGWNLMTVGTASKSAWIGKLKRAVNPSKTANAVMSLFTFNPGLTWLMELDGWVIRHIP